MVDHAALVKKLKKNFGENFFWVLAGIPEPGSKHEFEYYIIPASVMSKNVYEKHQQWLKTPGQKGQPHNDNKVRMVLIPPRQSELFWDISEFRNRWDLIEEKLKLR